MASACVNKVTLPPSSIGCFSPRISFSRDTGSSDPTSNPAPHPNPDPDPDPDDELFIDFEFLHLNDAAMLPADELFSDGKLLPLQIKSDPKPDPPLKPSPDTLIGSGSNPDSFAVSPKAPTCSSRWRELLRLKRQQQQQQSDPSTRNPNPNLRSLKQFLLHRTSLSDELPGRLSVDAENRPNQNPILLNRNPPARAGRRSSARAGRSPARKAAAAERCSSVDSPRMNASGKVVFQGLGRSSSSPSTFNGRNHRHHHRGMERSYSTNVRVAPVLNVPILKSASVFGFFSGSGSGSGQKGKS